MTTKPSLDALLRSGEWDGAEFKAAKSALPKSVFGTVSAFANTRGGWIVLGVAQDGERFEVSGVDEPDKMQNDLLSVLRAGLKVSHDVDERRYEHEGKVVLAFHIKENPRTRKPVTFLRKGGGYRAQPHELKRMLRDAMADRWDGQPFTRVSLDEAFHSASLKWYPRPLPRRESRLRRRAASPRVPRRLELAHEGERPAPTDARRGRTVRLSARRAQLAADLYRRHSLLEPWRRLRRQSGVSSPALLIDPVAVGDLKPTSTCSAVWRR